MTDFASQQAAGQAAIANFASTVQSIRQRTEAAQAAMTSASSTVTSPDGAVTVTVNAGGVLTALSFGAGFASLSGDALSRLVLTTTSDAANKALAEAERRLAEVVGADDPAVAALHKRVKENEPEVPAAAAADDDDDAGFVRR